jgi:Aldehyde dehydrogenase family/Xylose isomerase-like TIM barrel
MIMVDDGATPAWTSEEENYTLMRYTLQEAALVAEPRGIKIAIETHGPYTVTPQRLAKIMRLIDSPALTINLDTGNSYLSENDPHEWLEQIIGEVSHMHAKDISHDDAERLRGKVRGMLGCACGDGVIDWKRIVDTLTRADHDVVLSVECGSLDAATKSYTYLSALIDAAKTQTATGDSRLAEIPSRRTPVNAIPRWINNKAYPGSGGDTLPVTNPARGEVTGEVALASAEDARAVIDAAAAAFPAWRDTSLAQRAQILFAFRELLNARKRELAEIITSELGKVVSDALVEVSRGQEVVEFACGIPHLLKGGFTENASTKVDVYSIHHLCVCLETRYAHVLKPHTVSPTDVSPTGKKSLICDDTIVPLMNGAKLGTTSAERAVPQRW